MSATLTANTLIKKEADFKSNIKRQHATTNILAEYLAHDGGVEKTARALLQDGSGTGSDNDSEEMKEFESFLTTQRDRVKTLTERHIASMRHVSAFISAVKHVKLEIQNGTHTQSHTDLPQAATDDGDGEDGDVKPNTMELPAPPDFGNILSTRVEMQKQQESESYIDMKDEEMMKTIRELLHEKNENDDDDIELEIQNNESEAHFKCPVLGTVFENPVRNKFCGHVYDLKGIRFHLRTKRSCPQPGCHNQNVTLSQVEEDVEMKMRVRRFNSRVERERKQRMTQDDENIMDVDNDDMDDNGTTYVS